MPRVPLSIVEAVSSFTYVSRDFGVTSATANDRRKRDSVVLGHQNSNVHGIP